MSATPKRRGRRPAGEDTKEQLLQAAREVFTEQGYDRATVRMIAARAGVDPAMVNHWFGGKEKLFLAAVQLPINPAEVIDQITKGGDPDRFAEQMLRTFLTVWDTTGGGAFAALVRSVASHELAAKMLRELFVRVVFGRVVKMLDTDQPQLRATLCASQLVGLGMVRYVVKFEPLASADHDTIVAAIAPNLQRYLTGDITGI